MADETPDWMHNAFVFRADSVLMPDLHVGPDGVTYFKSRPATEEEKAELERRHQEWLQEQREQWIVYVSAWGRLHAIRDSMEPGDPVRRLLELHWPATWRSEESDTDEPISEPKCWGCDQGCSCDSPNWPCSTMRILCEELGVELPEEHTFITRPRDD